MAFLTGVMTTVGRAALAKSFGKLGGNDGSHAAYFRIGTGGYIDTGSGRIPKDPSEALAEIEAVTGAMFYFEKALTPSDFVFVAPSIIQIRCRLDGIEANDDGFGEEPEFFELGIYDDQDVLVAYTTFPQQTKASNKILTNYVQCYF